MKYRTTPTDSDRKRFRYKSHKICDVIGRTTKPLNLSNSDRLNVQLLEMYQMISPTEAEIRARTLVYEKFRDLILEVFPDAEVAPFGSFSTKLIISDSDIDISVNFAGASADKSFRNIKIQRLTQRLRKAKYIFRHTILHIKNTRVPVLRFKESKYGFRVDIVINQTQGIDTSNFIRQVLKERPYMRVYTILLKYFLAKRNLSDARMGGLNSYAQFLMLLNFFQLHPIIQTKKVCPIKNIGILFLDFFQLYGFDFPFEQAMISVTKVAYQPNITKTISIEDPCNAGADVCLACKNIEIIREVFKLSYRSMVATFKCRIKPDVSLVSLWFKISTQETINREKIINQLLGNEV